MQLFEIKKDIVTINIDTNLIRKLNKKSNSKIDFGDYNEFLIDKVKKGNQEAILKSIVILKNILLKNGCSSYEQLYQKNNLNKEI